MGSIMKTRKLLLMGIGLVTLGLVASLILLFTVLPKVSEQQTLVAGKPSTTPQVENKIETKPSESEVPQEQPEADANVQVETPVQEETLTKPQLGMSVNQLEQLLGAATAIRAVEAAYVFEYPEHTFVVDEQQQVIGYWLYPEQQNQLEELQIDWQKGFAQESTVIDWHGPYANDGRGSAYVLYGYTIVEGKAYALEFGADDELGLSNQLVAIYQR